MIDNVKLVSLADIAAARDVIGNKLHRTQLMGSTTLGKLANVQLYFKPELFQKTGAFKVRGVLNKLAHLTDEEKKKGVVSLSAGNHAQALAWASTAVGVHSVIVMPSTAVAGKVAATKGYGGEVIHTDGDLLATCLQIQRERDLTLVHPFDDPYVIAGQGTVGLEILEDLPDVDMVIAGIGGGGLISGVGAAMKGTNPAIRVIGVEPIGAAAMSASLKSGKKERLEKTDTIADGLAAMFVGDYTFPHVKALVDEVVLVSDQEIIEAMRLLLERCKLVVEPAAASTVAALLSGRLALPEGGKVVCILSGGNIDSQRLKAYL